MNPNFPGRFRLLIPLFILAFLTLVTLVVYALWNGVLTEVLAVKTITYWQALGLLLLARILFGGWSGGIARGLGAGRRARMMSKRWEALDPEQRQRLREEMRGRFGDWPHPPWEGCKDRRAGDPVKPADGQTK